MLSSALYKIEDLVNTKDDYYPIVMSIEAVYPSNYTGRAKKSIQFTYGQFLQDQPGILKFKFLKQKFLVRIHYELIKFSTITQSSISMTSMVSTTTQPISQMKPRENV